MSKNGWILILIIGAVLVGAWIIVRHKNSWDGSLNACPDSMRICPDGSSVGATGPNCEFKCPSIDFVWNFTEIPQEEGGQGPRTKVSVNIRGTNYDVGSHVGSCNRIKDTSWPLLESEIDGAICWFAGSGVEIGIFKEDGKLMIKKGDISEATAEDEGVRGNFELLFGL